MKAVFLMVIGIGDREVEIWWDGGYEYSLTEEILQYIEDEISDGMKGGTFEKEEEDGWHGGNWRIRKNYGHKPENDADDDDLILFGLTQGWFKHKH
jgi:hypothetical protein